MSNLVNLRYKDCSMCTSLPSIGQLPFLKYLFIRRIARVKSMGSKFYGNGCSAPFPSLETLCFQDMQEWESGFLMDLVKAMKVWLICESFFL